jgi:nicotinamide riboside kinase
MSKSEIEHPKSKIKKIAVVGPESIGKSTMSAYLAKHYNTFGCPSLPAAIAKT